MNQGIQESSEARKRTRMAVYLGLLPNGVVMLTGLPLFWAQPGTAIRPMGWAAAVMVMTLAPLVVVPYGIHAILKEGSCWALVGIFLSLAPLPLSFCLLKTAERVIGFTLSP